MNSLKRNKIIKQAVFIGFALIVSLSCLPSSLISNINTTNTVSTPTNTIDASINPTETTAPETQPTDASQQTPSENVSNDEPLNAAAPWLLIESSQGLWAANPDGSALRQLTNVDYWRGNLKQAIQPAGNHIVFLTPGNYDFHHMALNLLSLPDGQITKITDLTSASTEAYADLNPGETGFEALRAIGEMVSYAWSPDGSQLAFSGVMDGPSADIYLYNVQTGAITRVSQDPAQDFAPSWSPDGNHLLYLAADGFGTGAGWTMSGVWAADGTGGNPTQLFASDSAGEVLEGWLDNTTVVIATWDQPCGLQKLRLLNLDSNQTSILDSDCFNSATTDGYYGVALYSNSSGIYILTAEDHTPIQVDPAGDAFIDRRYPADQVFTVRFNSGGLATFGNLSQYDYQVSPVQASSYELDVAIYGAIWGWTSQNEVHPGAWITGPGVDIGQIYDSPSILPIWNQDNDLLFFASQDSGFAIYLTTFNSFYSDLNRVNFIESNPTCVAWLGWK
jgi:Tol biopolymer transport system component